MKRLFKLNRRTIFGAVLACVMLLTMTACGDTASDQPSEETTTSASAVTTTQAPTTTNQTTTTEKTTTTVTTTVATTTTTVTTTTTTVPAVQRGTITVTILDAQTGSPIEELEVEAVRTDLDFERHIGMMYTDANGKATFELECGTYALMFYSTVYQEGSIVVTLDSAAVTPDPVYLEKRDSKSGKALAPEAAVDIYMNTIDMWLNTPDYPPMQGYGYCFIDLDFDDTLELIHSVNDGSGRYSYNTFYKLNVDTQTVEEMITENDPSIGGPDYYLMRNGVKLYEDGNTGEVFYVVPDVVYVDATTSGTTNYKVYEENGTVYEHVYDPKQTDIDMGLVYTYVYGTEFANADDSGKRQMLLDAYKAFGYDGFTIGGIGDYYTVDVAVDEPQQEEEPLGPPEGGFPGGSFAMADYVGYTIADIEDTWGSDYTVMDGLISGGWGAIYYEDERCPFLFCFASSGIPAACTGDEVLTGVIVYPTDEYTDVFIADGWNVVCSKDQARTHVGGTMYFSEIDNSDVFTYNIADDVIVNMLWQSDDDVPTEITVIFK